MSLENEHSTGLGYEEMAELYPDHSVRALLFKAVMGFRDNGVINQERAVSTLRLGEPAIYGALTEIKAEADKAPHTTAA